MTPFTHDWRPGDRIASIAVRESVAETGLGTIQRVVLEKAIVLWMMANSRKNDSKI